MLLSKKSMQYLDIVIFLLNKNFDKCQKSPSFTLGMVIRGGGVGYKISGGLLPGACVCTLPINFQC